MSFKFFRIFPNRNLTIFIIRENQLMVGGESAGGCLAAALTLYARDQDEVYIIFEMPLYPMIDDRMATESSKENIAPIWNSRMNEWSWKLYLGKLYNTVIPYYAASSRATDYNNLLPRNYLCWGSGNLQR